MEVGSGTAADEIAADPASSLGPTAGPIPPIPLGGYDASAPHGPAHHRPGALVSAPPDPHSLLASAAAPPSDTPVVAPRPEFETGRGPAPALRATLADAFLCEYHRLAAAALRATQADPVAGAALLRRAATWRVTAYRIRNTAPRRWPKGVIEHLTRCAALPEVGLEYARQHRLLTARVAVGEPPGGPR